LRQLWQFEATGTKPETSETGLLDHNSWLPGIASGAFRFGSAGHAELCRGLRALRALLGRVVGRDVAPKC